MGNLTCIIIEDEKPAQDVLISFVSRIQSLELSATFGDALEAMEYLKTNDPDVIFLDIQIPSLNGIEFLRILKNPPQVIITSAYSQYAIDAFDLDVRDYLMKPFSFERFVKSVNRITPKPDTRLIYQMREHDKTDENAFAFFNVNKTMIRVLFKDILFVESMREYVYIHTDKGKVVTKIGIGEMEKLLGAGFIRTHRSFLVRQDKVTAFNAEELFIEKCSIPIGANYKKSVNIAFGKAAE